MKTKTFGIIGALTAFFFAGSLSAQRHRSASDRSEADGTSTQIAPCFNAGDPQDIRLWPGDAPGAIGTDPCRDIPFLRVYRAARPSQKAIVLIPGGGYDRLTDAKEQGPVAEYFSQKLGVTTFLLTYRLARKDGTYRYPVPMIDGQRAIRWVRAHSAEFGIDPDSIGAFGFSAGGHLASTLALHSAAQFGTGSSDSIDGTSARLNFLGLGYPVISMDPAAVPPTGSYNNLLRGYRSAELAKLQQYLSGEKNIAPHTPPVFLFESMDDQRISPANSTLFVDALHRAGVPVDAHIYAHGEHGAGLAQGIPEEDAWPQAFTQWFGQQR